MTHVQRAHNSQAVATYLAELAKASGKVFDFAAFSRDELESQRRQLVDLFYNLNAGVTSQLMTDLAKRGRLALVKHGRNWFFQVSQIFDLPLEFDIEIPKTKGAHLRGKNLRELHQSVQVVVYDGKTFPSDPMPVIASADSENAVADSANVEGSATAALFQKVLGYYARRHAWYNYGGRDPNGQLDVYIGIEADRLRDNAAWVPQLNMVIVGAGGPILANVNRSGSVLGHEFTHAVVERTSGLVYRGETGALNEHFADIQGMVIDAEITGQPLSFLIGEDALSPNVTGPKKLLTKLILKTLPVSAGDIQKYSLDRLGLRHLYMPELSFTKSYPSVADAASDYTADCEPSADNDNCGVHTRSGIPNRAVSIIIDAFGVDRARDMIFNTVTMRLNANSTFQEYVRQMYEECLVTSGLDPGKDCPTVITAFATVGVAYPKGAPPPTPDVPTSQDPTPSQPPPPSDVPNQPQASPLLKMCGRTVVNNTSRNVTIIDNKFDTAILVSKYTTLTKGNFAPLYGYACACASGHIAQTQNSKGTWFNYFADIVAIQQRPVEACRGIVVQ